MAAHENSFRAFPTTDHVDLLPFQCGREFCKPGHSFGPARRSHYLFHYVISGKGTLLSRDCNGDAVTHQLHGGQGFMIFPDQINTYVADEDDPWVYTWVEFDGMNVRDMLELVGLTPSSPIYETGSDELRATVEQELIFMSAHPEAPTMQLMGHLYLFLDALTRSATRPRSASGRNGSHDIHVQLALRYVERHYGEDITVADMAKSTGLNPSYFGRLFKESTGRTPQQHLIHFRMTKAAELLKLTALSVGEVGAAVGYPNQLHFSRAFKAVHGLSPREWRKENSRPPQG